LNAAMVRILLCGDVRGDLPKVCKCVDALQRKLPEEQRFRAVFCVGEFSAEEMNLEVEEKPSVPIYFIDCGPACQDLIDESPQGDEVAPNVHFLGHYGVTSVAGLKVAYLSGRLKAELFEEQDENYDEDGGQALPQADDLKSKYAAQEGDRGLFAGAPPALETEPSSSTASRSSSGPSWEELKAKEKKKEFMQTQLFLDGRYTPLAVERLFEEIGDSGGVDILLTSEWPKGILGGLKDAWPEEAEARRLAKSAVRQCCSPAVAELAVAAEPKYHAVGLGGVFWRRAPWRHERRGEVEASTGTLKCGVCRMITLGAVDGSRPGVNEAIDAQRKYSYKKPEELEAKTKPQKWLHGLDLDPKSMPTDADDATPSPWAEKAVKVEDPNQPPERPDFSGMDKDERRRWMQRFGIKPHEMLQASDKIEKENQPKEKKEKRQSLYKVSEKEKKRRKTGSDSHLPFSARERMQAGRG